MVLEVPPKLKDRLENGPDLGIRDPIVHIDAADAGPPGVARSGHPRFDGPPDVPDTLAHDLDRAQADVEEGLGELFAEEAQVAAPADVEEIEMRQLGEDLRRSGARPRRSSGCRTGGGAGSRRGRRA